MAFLVAGLAVGGESDLQRALGTLLDIGRVLALDGTMTLLGDIANFLIY